MKKLFSFKLYLGSEDVSSSVNTVYAEKWEQALMKKVAYSLLLAYTLMLCKPAAPIIIDGMAHTFWESRHLMTVHEEHGKFHVHYETVNSGDRSDKNKPVNSAKTGMTDDVYIPVVLVYEYFNYISPRVAHNSYAYSYRPIEIPVNYRPPRA